MMEVARSAALALLLCLAGCRARIGEDSLLVASPGAAVAPETIHAAAPGYAMSEHWIVAPDGTRLHALLLRQSGAQATVLYFGGNGYSISAFGPATARVFAPLGVDLMIVDRRGSGRSEGRPSAATLEADGIAAFDYLSGQVGVPAGRIVVHGHSLGSFVAGHVAAERAVGGVVLESSTTTVEDWVEANRRGLMRLLVSVEIDPVLRGRGNLGNVARIEAPLLLLVGARDRVTPAPLSQALYRASTLPPGRKTLAVIAGAGHEDVMIQEQAAAVYRDFLRNLAAR